MKESPIFSKTYELLQWIIQTTVKFPRQHRFVLAESLQKSALALYEYLLQSVLITANVQNTLVLADCELAKIRMKLRLCLDLELYTIAQYEHVGKLVRDIGNMLGKWRTSVAKSVNRG
jgi:hypothetical protein